LHPSQQFHGTDAERAALDRLRNAIFDEQLRVRAEREAAAAAAAAEREAAKAAAEAKLAEDRTDAADVITLMTDAKAIHTSMLTLVAARASGLSPETIQRRVRTAWESQGQYTDQRTVHESAIHQAYVLALIAGQLR
jgi:hypothetical protein